MKKTTITTAFGHINDPRMNRTKRHNLIDIITISICAIISGCDNFCTIAKYGEAKEAWLKEFLELPNGIPSHDTFNDVLNRLNPIEFGKAFTDWVTSLSKLTGDIIAIDGKTMRGTLDKANDNPAIHLVSAWSVSNQLCFGQVSVFEKSNEITAIPKLLEMLDIEGATITIDAMGCQHKIADQIVAAKGDYVLALKGNQGEFYEDVKLFLDTQLKNKGSDVSHDCYQSIDGDHGRIEQRKVWLFSDMAWLRARHPQWKTVQSVAVVESVREVQGQGETYERRYYICSHGNSSAAFIAYAIRSHWHVENKLHWQLDVSFQEDSNRLRSGHAAENIALMNKIALNLLKNENSTKDSMKTKRLLAGWNNNYLLKILTVGFSSV